MNVLGTAMCWRQLIGTNICRAEVYDGVMVRRDVLRCLDVEPGENTILTNRQGTCDNREGAPDTSFIGVDAREMSVAHNMELRYTKCKFSLKKH